MLSTMHGQLPGLFAGADLSEKQYFAVKVTAANTVELCGNNEIAVGILINKPTAGLGADVFALGDGYAKVDGNAAAITFMDRLRTDGNGKLRKINATHDKVAAIALEASTVDNDIIRVLVVPANHTQ